MRPLKVLIFVLLAGCSSQPAGQSTLFTEVTQSSGIDFRNDLVFTERLNPYTYRNFYNGAGVAIGDINNDGLLDVYFAGNQVDNKLYLNAGNLQFTDITATAGVSCAGAWSTGVTFADVNADGWLDLYVCKSGDPEGPRRHNELFINNGDLTFSERSAEYGLDVTGLSVQAAFFDYDKDGDLDCYLLTNSIRSVGNYDLVKGQRGIPDAQGGGNKFFLNDNGKFVDFSADAGIYRSSIGFGLGITLGDFNNDTWPDIFVSNDFFERDYLYINNRHGGFKESLTEYFQSISMGSMGADFADLDGDGDPELFVTEMLPDSLTRRKTKTVFETWDKYQLTVQNGYHHQFPRNVLHKKVSPDNYVEVGRMAGIAASEWSWGALLFDMDNDGRRDIFIANGIYKDLLDRDYLSFTAAEENVRAIIEQQDNPILKLIALMPASTFPNYAFRNEGDLNFRNVATLWGLDVPMFSSGSAYGDLDNDGDLDLVVSNTNAPSLIYRNNSDTSKFKSLTVSLSASEKNTFEVGSVVTAYCGARMISADNYVTRGFQSSVQPKVHLGLGDISSIDSVVVRWPDSGYSVVRDVKPNDALFIRHDDVKVYPTPEARTVSSGLQLERAVNVPFVHQGSGLVDFNRDRLLPMMFSNETPAMLKGDIDKDGLDEIYIGGGKDQPGTFISFRDGKIASTKYKVFSEYAISEETRGALFDADGDGDLDLYMSTGGRYFPATSSALLDRIFINDGKGAYSESEYPLPFTGFVSTSTAVPLDFDNDHDMDLLIGERFHPFFYGTGGRGFLLENNGKGLFTDVTAKAAPFLLNVGMITDAEAQDIDNDGWMDLVIVGDWMPVTVLRNNKGSFTDATGELGLSGTEGWWHDIEPADLNRDGKPDFIVGNHGLNSFFKEGDRMYVSDFDGNGSVEQIYCTTMNGKYYPVADRDELVSQLPSLKKKLLFYKDYAKKTIDDLFPPAVLEAAKMFEVKLLSSIVLLSTPQGYQKVLLPKEAQYSTIYSLLAMDFDGDGVTDVIAGGNQYGVKPQFGRYDASNGWFFKGTFQNGRHQFLGGQDLNVKGQIRDIEYIKVKNLHYLLFTKHDSDLEIYRILN